MIRTRQDYYAYMEADARACRRKTIKAKLLGDDLWKLQVSLRKEEYFCNFTGMKRVLFLPAIIANKVRFHNLSVRCGIEISPFCFEEGLSIAHKGLVIVNSQVRVGRNCRIQDGVTVGTTNGSQDAPKIGNNVFIGSGAKIIGHITIADDVAIGANAVVVKSICEPGTTWAGVPAKKISNKDSHANLSPFLDDWK